jgi:hypothetical protein
VALAVAAGIVWGVGEALWFIGRPGLVPGAAAARFLLGAVAWYGLASLAGGVVLGLTLAGLRR